MFDRIVRLGSVFLMATTAAASAQTPAVPAAAVTPSPLKRQADSALAAKDYGRAVTLYRQIVARTPGDGGAWNQLGAAYYATNEFARAADAYQHAFTASAVPFSRYNASTSWARAGNADRAIAVLDSMAHAGFSQLQLVEQDSDFGSLHADPRYQAAVALIHRNARPCESNPRARELDFWVGEWNVTSQRGAAGTSSVQLILGSCIVFENWTGRFGDEGKSFNVYDAAKDEWQQYWVANQMQGSSLFTQGIYADGKMQYRHSEFKGPDGKINQRRLTFFNIDHDHVRQLSEKSADGGATWATEYDFLYTRKR
jgi:tetratricopeptide (TPR) repeat protein